ncbi:MAG: hypothetical protein Q8K98_08260, partial [Bacteroidota bacterium]|nr:hypothetical protein [Bacteroidota bacterium]
WNGTWEADILPLYYTRISYKRKAVNQKRTVNINKICLIAKSKKKSKRYQIKFNTRYTINKIAKIVTIIFKKVHSIFIGNQIGKVINFNNHFISNPISEEQSTKPVNTQPQTGIPR